MATGLLSYSLTGIVAHLVYFGIASVAVVVFLAIYVMVTPHHEFRLIRQGNTAAAVSLGGVIIGYTIPLAKAVSQSESIGHAPVERRGAGRAAGGLWHHASRSAPPVIACRRGEDSVRNLPAAISVAIGLLNAAAMTE